MNEHPRSIKGARATTSLPPSVTATWINLVALGTLVLTLWSLRQLLQFNGWGPTPTFTLTGKATLVWLVLLSVTVPIVLLEYWYFGDRLGAPKEHNKAGRLERTMKKSLGLIVSFGIMYLCFWLFPYFENERADLVTEVLRLGSTLLLLAPLYIWFVDVRMSEPKDGYYMVGQLFTGAWHTIDQNLLKQHALSWLVKIFFLHYITLPLASVTIWAITNDHQREISTGFVGFVDVFITSAFLVDICFAAVGYYVTLRLFDSHARSTDETLYGWIVCIICYGIIWEQFTRKFFTNYTDGHFWAHWLSGLPTLQILWGIPIILCLSVYAAASMQFGIRFSNLSHRGIITNGVYRWSKHPAYISKNISWWLIEVPFIHQAGFIAELRMCLLLLCINIIYYLRAKTEEQHLAKDEVYQQYADWVATHGLIARLKRVMC